MAVGRNGWAALCALAVVAGGCSGDEPGASGAPDGATVSAGVASCVDAAADVVVLGGAEPIPGPPEARVDLLAGEIEVDNDALQVRWVARHDVYVAGDSGPLVQHNAGPLVATVGPYVIWAYPPDGPELMLLQEDLMVSDPEQAELPTAGTVARDGPVVEVAVPLADLPDLDERFTWSVRATARLVDDTSVLMADDCGVGPNGVSEETFPGRRLDAADLEASSPPGGAAPSSTASADGSSVTPEDHSRDLLEAWLGGELAQWEDRLGPDVYEALEQMGDSEMADWCGGDISMCTIEQLDCEGDDSSTSCDFTIATQNGGLMGSVSLSVDPVGAELGGDYWAVTQVDFFVE